MYVSKRHDGSFETLVNGYPYHVTPGDERHAALAEEYPDLAPGMAIVDGVETEDHRNEFGYVGGEPRTMHDFGPLPEGWSGTPPPPAPDELGRRFNAAVGARLTAFVAERGWDSLDRVLAQRGEFAADAAAAQSAYDAAWSAALASLPQVRSGELTIDSALAALPALEWQNS